MQHIFIFFLSILSVLANKPNTISRNGYTLNVHDKDSNMPKDLVDKLVNTFFKVYPREVRDFNPQSPKVVNFTFDPSYNGVAYTTQGTSIVFSSKYMKSNPKDLDVVTHEAFHVVQHPWGDPSWLLEGIADYARFKYGVNNAAAGWSLPKYSSDQKYDAGYKTTAAFLKFVEQKHPGTVKSLFTKMRTKQYSENSWVQLTKSTVTQLWQAYGGGSSTKGRKH